MKIEICESSGRVYAVSVENGSIKKEDVTSQAIEAIKREDGEVKQGYAMWQ